MITRSSTANLWILLFSCWSWQHRHGFVSAVTSTLTAAAAAAAAAADSDTNGASATSPQQSPLQCDLYLAPSTIPNAGQGIFSGVEKDVGDTIGNGDKALPIIDLYWNNGDYYEFPDPPAIDMHGMSVLMDPQNPHRRLSDRDRDGGDEGDNGNPTYKIDKQSLFADDAPEFFNQFGDYVWDGKDMGMQWESIHDDVTTFWPGMDALVNCHSALPNVEKATPIYSEDGLHRSTHPGAGAVSPYHAGPSYVTRHIPAGGELFKYYGDSWFTTREHRFGRLPLAGDYENIIFYISSIQAIANVIATRRAAAGKTDVLEMGSVIYNELIRPIKDMWDSRRLNALHDFTYEEMLKATVANDMGLLIQPNATRSVEWLNENGKCIDHIVQGPSTIDGAGQGAFAKRFLPKGTIITGTPLLHNPNSDQFIVYNQHPDTTEDGVPVHRRMIDSVRGRQLMYNYCFGHPDSSILLCPDSAGVNYINHASSISSSDSDNKQPTANVRIQWAKDGMTSHRDEWLKKTPEEMYELGSFLAFDYVALRDIQEGEEIFLDYGPDWEKAWSDHVQNWFKSDAADPSYVSSTQMNSRKESLRTLEEQKTDPYPGNLVIMCHLSLRERYTDFSQLEWEDGDHGTPCDVLSRHVDEKTGVESYNVAMRYIHHHSDGDREVSRIVEKVPRVGMKFLDRQYTTDLHMPQAFRHFIGIADDIMPDQWKNRRRRNNDKSKEASACVEDDNGGATQQCTWKDD